MGNPKREYQNINRSRLLIVRLFQLVLMLGLGSTVRSAAAENVIACGDGNVDIIISYGDIVSPCSIEVIGSFDLIRFSGSIGETILLKGATLVGPGSVAFDLTSPSGVPVTINAFGDAGLDENGTYTLEVTDNGNNQTLSYALTIERTSPPSPTARSIQDGDTLSDAIDPIVDQDPFSFEVADPVPITVDFIAATTGGSGSPILALFGPDGARVTINAFGEAELDQIGAYSIFVADNGNNQTLNYNLSLACISGCNIVPTPDVEGCVKLIGGPLINRTVRLTQTGEPTDSTSTDSSGCYEFPEGSLVSGKTFNVRILGPVAP